MSNKEISINLLIISLVLLLMFSINIDKIKTPTLQNEEIHLVPELDTFYIVDTVVESLPTNFNLIYSSFKTYNPYTDSSSAFSFANVSNCFGFGDDETIRWLLGQVLLESGGKQYYQPTHPKEGQLVVSSAGAIGFTQILPSTAYGYMVKKLSQEDKEFFKELGVTDYSFAYDNLCSRSEKLVMTKQWLTNENNNIVMWGKIMSSKLKTKSMFDALISYNAGSRGLQRFLNAGNTQEEHNYIRGIKSRLKYINI